MQGGPSARQDQVAEALWLAAGAAVKRRRIRDADYALVPRCRAAGRSGHLALVHYGHRRGESQRHQAKTIGGSSRWSGSSKASSWILSAHWSR